MLKITSLGLAAAVSATAAIPSVAFAIDNGPCDHCTMEPIVVKGERPKKDTSQAAEIRRILLEKPTPGPQIKARK